MYMADVFQTLRPSLCPRFNIILHEDSTIYRTSNYDHEYFIGVISPSAAIVPTSQSTTAASTSITSSALSLVSEIKSIYVTELMKQPDSTFLKLFQDYRDPIKHDPSEKKIKEIWTRLLPRDKYKDGESRLPRAMAMAVIYMLHVETNNSTRNDRPQLNDKDSDGYARFDHNRREKLKRFCKWTPCQCAMSCRMAWNFVDDVGICNHAENVEVCQVARMIGIGEKSRAATPKLVRILEGMREDWTGKDLE